MLRNRNLMALLMAAMLSLGTMGTALASDSSPRTEEPGVQVELVADAAN